jgi:hypothetical protein
VKVNTVVVTVSSGQAWNSSATQVGVDIPSGAGTGAIHLQVKTGAGWSPISTADMFTITGPQIISVSPTTLSPDGGIQDIHGLGLGDATQVCLGSTCLSSGSGSSPGTFSVLGAEDLQATLPSDITEGPYTLMVVTPEGDSNGVAVTVLIDVAAPAITGLFPTSGVEGTQGRR